MADPRIEEAIASGQVPSNITAAYLGRNRDSEGIGGIVLVTLLVIAVVVSRLLSRALVVKRLGLDDGLALTSLIIFVPFAIVCTEMIRLGSGRPFTFRKLILPDEQFDMTQTLDTVSQLLYATTLVLCRASGLAFYHRICALYNEFLIIIKFIFFIIFLGYLAQMSLIILHCMPVTTLWEPSPLGKFKCVSWIEVQVVSSTISLLSDLLVFGIPLAMLHVLKSMDRKRKVQLSCIFFPGLIVVFISIARIALAIIWDWETDDDFIYAFLSLLVVEVSEIGVSLIAISLPGLRPLFDKYIMRKSNNHDTPSPRSSVHHNTQATNFKLPRLSIDSLEKSGAAGFEVKTITSVKSPNRDSTAKKGNKATRADEESTMRGISVTSEFMIEEQDAQKPDWGTETGTALGQL
ncbi:hypothetical protein XA68_12612 [Ophiocordyceps unilateralis]|uniref:Rhodopsin domain-containing protein n=1 Tax=Ophiocordyceps unilateralis TaxID=268505 RepID=A0A2A9PED0_OPHUN|nr:hypothetical protein XA68_12612 [Ophiocordyceps unilateralis]